MTQAMLVAFSLQNIDCIHTLHKLSVPKYASTISLVQCEHALAVRNRKSLKDGDSLYNIYFLFGATIIEI